MPAVIKNIYPEDNTLHKVNIWKNGIILFTQIYICVYEQSKSGTIFHAISAINTRAFEKHNTILY